MIKLRRAGEITVELPNQPFQLRPSPATAPCAASPYTRLFTQSPPARLNPGIGDAEAFPKQFLDV